MELSQQYLIVLQPKILNANLFRLIYLEIIGILANLLEEIGDKIDFLILDTVHMLPGEILDLVVAEKKSIFSVDNKYGYPNIATFEVTGDTYKYIYNIFIH